MYFRNKYYFLSNMYPCDMKVKINDQEYTFSCLESVYQGHKCLQRINEFINLDGYSSKKLGKIVKLRKDWDDVKVDLMKSLLRIKFNNPELKEKLISVEGEIVETNNWGDRFWGKCYGKGLNILGNLLMELREEYKKELKK